MHSSAPLRFPAPRGLPRSKLDTPPLPPQRPRQRPSPCPPRSQRPPLPPKALRRPRRSPPQGPAPRKQQELSSSSGVQVSALSQPQREGVKTKMQLERGSAPSACPTQGGASGGSGGGRAASSGRSSGECSTAHHTKRQLGQAFHRHARRGRASSLDIMGILAELGYSAAPEGIELLLWAVRSSDEEALSLREVRRLLHEGVVTQVIRPAAHGRSGDGEKKARSAVQWVVAQRPAPGSGGLRDGARAPRPAAAAAAEADWAPPAGRLPRHQGQRQRAVGRRRRPSAEEQAVEVAPADTAAVYSHRPALPGRTASPRINNGFNTVRDFCGQRRGVDPGRQHCGPQGRPAHQDWEEGDSPPRPLSKRRSSLRPCTISRRGSGFDKPPRPTSLTDQITFPL
eukprot:TRINITY_DN25417_c0_g1_i2.p1 TRINITY_DN25417_c0_g1~~TRINITY_DN25417_c0_g1_i2.p1  ORF type:complete len:398 (+),score=44.27 TRINITY_DN25417_c0_g1_i2:569-1762(+)